MLQISNHRVTKTPSTLHVVLLILFFITTTLWECEELTAQPTLEWVRTYNKEDSSSDFSKAIVIDKWGNSIVTGDSHLSNGRWVISTVKYNGLGEQQWIRIFNDTLNMENYASDIAVDSSGNIFVSGYSGIWNVDYYSILIKYNINGDTKWTRKYFSPGMTYRALDVTTDKDGNIYITGEAYMQSFTIKYNTDGDTLWTRTHIEPGYLGSRTFSIAVDSSGNVYAGGYSWKTTDPVWDFDYLIIKYDSSGNMLWSRSYGNLTYNDYCKVIAIDRKSNVFLTGYQYYPGRDFDYLTVKYNRDGIFQWARTYSLGDDYVRDICIDNQDNVIITGKVSGIIGGSNYCTIKYNTNGDQLWAIQYDGPANQADDAYSITSDSLNNIYVTGRSGFYSWEIATIKYTTNGIEDWVTRYPGRGIDIALDKNRNIFVLGENYFYNTNLVDFVTIKYSQLVNILSNNDIIPETYRLSVKPNPFNAQTILNLDNAATSYVTLEVFNVLGEKVETLVKNILELGKHQFIWNAENQPSGIYFCRIEADKYVNSKKMILLK